MANDNQASYAKIGFFIVVGVALIAATLVRLGGADAANNEFLAETYFTDSVSGLDVGSAVNLRGVRVGVVKAISFAGAVYPDLQRDDRQKILVTLALDKRQFCRKGRPDTPRQILDDMLKATDERQGLHATVSASGVTGLSHIELNFPKSKIPDEKPGWRSDNAVIPPAPSILQNVEDSARHILAQLDQIDLVAAWTNILDVTRNASAALGNLNETLSSEQGGISEIVGNIRDASSSLREFADQIKNNPSSVLRAYTPDRLEETR